eukprot:scaffold298174_cov43-Prasinocladus_malaysianus.AAC.1
MSTGWYGLALNTRLAGDGPPVLGYVRMMPRRFICVLLEFARYDVVGRCRRRLDRNDQALPSISIIKVE